MGSTITEKILARAAGRDEVHAGDIIEAKIDLALANDITAPLAIAEFEKAGFDKVFDPARIALVPDHFTPNKDIKAAGQSKKMREFARRHEIVNYFEVGRVGIEHVLLPDTGMVAPGDVVIGADSHTCTYGAVAAFSTGVGSTDFAAAMAWGHVWLRVPESIKFVYSDRPQPWVTGKDLMLHTIGLIGVDGALYQAMEFTGDAIEALSMDERFTMCNMAIEAGGKSGIVGFDEKTTRYLQSRPEGSRARTAGQVFASDRDAEYARVLEIDVSAVPPTVSKPHLPSNTAAAADLGDIAIDQVVIGSCTNGRLEDLRQAAGILRGKKVHPDVRCIILPGTQQVCLDAIADGTMQTLIEAGCAFSTPTCGACLGGHMGVLAEGERAVATTNRNFVGRMGHPGAEVYLASPYVAAASALTGHIVDPRRSRRREGRLPMIFEGTVHKYGRDVDTDVIIPARYLNTNDPAELARHAMEDIDADFVSRVRPGDIIVAEENFGCGSSREHAPVAIKSSGVSVVVAASFARIFYRNAINTGLPIVVCPAAAADAKMGDRLKVDLAAGTVENATQGKTYASEAFPPFMQELIDRGGLLEYVKSRVAGEGA